MSDPVDIEAELAAAEKALERATKLTGYSADGVSITRPSPESVHVQVNRLQRQLNHLDASRRGARQPAVKVVSFSDS